MHMYIFFFYVTLSSSIFTQSRHFPVSVYDKISHAGPFPTRDIISDRFHAAPRRMVIIRVIRRSDANSRFQIPMGFMIEPGYQYCNLVALRNQKRAIWVNFAHLHVRSNISFFRQSYYKFGLQFCFIPII